MTDFYKSARVDLEKPYLFPWRCLAISIPELDLYLTDKVGWGDSKVDEVVKCFQEKINYNE